jgi:hypothetical protein
MYPIIALSMTEDVVMAVIGILLIVFGLKATAVSGAMPGAKPLYPPPLRFRVILVFFGVLMLALGSARLLRR